MLHKYSSAKDVYHNTDQTVELYIKADPHGCIVIGDSPEIEGGSFNLVIENRDGVPWIAIWTVKNFGHGPSYVIRLSPELLANGHVKP